MTFVCDVLEPILSAFRAIAAERGIRFEVVDEEILWCDCQYERIGLSQVVVLNEITQIVNPSIGIIMRQELSV